jgi:hypothetical protein
VSSKIPDAFKPQNFDQKEKGLMEAEFHHFIEELIFAVDKSCYVINILKASEMKAEHLINQKHVFIPHFYTLVVRCGGFIADIYSVEMMAFFL